MFDFIKSAVDKALQSENGNLDLFLRFLLGLSLESNQTLLKGLLTQTGSSSNSKEKSVQYIKEKISENPSPEKTINLFHCLNELNDHSLVQKFQSYLKRGAFNCLNEDKLSPTQWSAVAFVMLNSEKELDEFDLRNFDRSDDCLLRLLPLVKASRKAVLADCKLTEQSCDYLQSVLESENSTLKELDLSFNDLQDSGVEKLCAGLQSSHCKLEILRLFGCMVTEEGCCSLASALKSNPSHLRKLYLTCNYTGDLGMKEFSDLLEDPHCKLDTLSVEHGGEIRITPGLKKYFCRLTLDPNTAHPRLVLSEENRGVEWSDEDQSYSDHAERSDCCFQVLSKESVSGRCYWEVEWSCDTGGDVFISVSYKDIRRRGREERMFGYNSQSWSLVCSSSSPASSSSLRFLHNSIWTDLDTHPSFRIGVYVDHSAGTLSFYNIYRDTMTLLHTVNTTFTQTLYAGFYVIGGTVRFCDE